MQLWTVRHVAECLAVAPITVRRLIAEGKLPAVRLRKSVRVRAEDVALLIRMAANGKVEREIGQAHAGRD